MTIPYSLRFNPRYWFTWLGLFSMWVVARLPFRNQIGILIGKLGYYLARSRRHITEVNINLCFPELSPQARNALIRKIFRSIGLNLVETAMAWTIEPEKLKIRHTIEGLEYLEQAQKKNKGVLLLGAHFSTLDLAGALLSLHADIDVMYRRDKNPVFDAVMKKQREKLYGSAIERKSMRTTLKNLKSGRTIWYAADQDYGRKHSVFAPFFGVEAATISATARLAGANHSPVLFFSHYRDEDSGGYKLYISPPIEDYPSGDDIEDARRINKKIESAIRIQPDQYLWLHRRFKTRPENKKHPY